MRAQVDRSKSVTYVTYVPGTSVCEFPHVPPPGGLAASVSVLSLATDRKRTGSDRKPLTIICTYTAAPPSNTPQSGRKQVCRNNRVCMVCMCVCVYVCMCVCVYVCMYVCVYVCMYVHR